MKPSRPFFVLLLVSVGAALGAQCPDDPGAPPPLSPCPTRSLVASIPGERKCEAAAPGFSNELLAQSPSLTICRYQWQGDARGGEPLDAASTDLEKLGWRVARDCPVVTAAGQPSPPSPLPAARFQSMATAYRSLSGVPASGLGRGTQMPNVAVVDSAVHPYAAASSDTFEHGHAVGRVIADLACTGLGIANCGAKIANALALPLDIGATYPPTTRAPLPRNDVDGGFIGTRGDLAHALGTLSPPKGSGRLIVNMSVGWEGRLEKDESCPACKEVVRLSLERLWCRGAILIAAAGNGTRQGALFPAAWQTQTMNRAVCEKDGFAYERSQPAERNEPLVYAVGGLDAEDRALITTRPSGGTPRLMAYGMDVITTDHRGPQTMPLTGTSMAAATVSGVAALIWEITPALSPAEVMDTVYAKAVPLGRTADLCLGGPPCADTTVRVSACHVLGSLGAPTLAVCQTVPGPGAALPPPPLARDLPPVAQPTSWEDAPWLLPQPGPTGCLGCWLEDTTGEVVGWLPPVVRLSQSPAIQVDSGWGWNNGAFVTSSPFRVGLTAPRTVRSAASRFIVFVGFWLVLPPEALAVTP